MKRSKTYIDYHELLDEYEHNLLHQLRSFGSSREYLSLWVPSDNFKDSIVGLMYALRESGWTEVQLGFQVDYLVQREINLDKDILPLFDNIVVNFCSDGIVILDIKDIHGYHFKHDTKPKLVNEFNKEANNTSIKYKKNDISIEKYYFINTINEDFQAIKQEIDNKNLLMTSSKIASGEYLTIYIDNMSYKVTAIDFKRESNSTLSSILYALSKEVVGQHIQELLDHGVTSLEYKLRKPILKNTIKGVIVAPMISNSFKLIQDLIKGCFSDFQRQTNYQTIRNRWYKSPEKNWYDIDETEKIKQISQALIKFCSIENVSYSDINVDRIEKTRRVIISILGDSFDKASFLLHFELYLKNNLNACLEVYYQEMQDMNKLRQSNLITVVKER